MSYSKKIDDGEKVRLKDLDPGYTAGLSKAEAEAETAELLKELADLDNLLYASAKNSLLIVLQGLDTSGKDGTIRHLAKGINLLSCRVVPFKAPTAREMAQDFLWRIHQHTPPKGNVALFNRSHYEDVLVVRVHDLVPKEEWSRRYDHINNFESLLADSGTIILKFFLHISKKEQKKRLIERETEPDKGWKLEAADWKERQFWDDYTEAFEDAFRRCSSKRAPWFVIPADNKWFRDLAVTERIVKTLRDHRKDWEKALEDRGVKAHREIAEYRAAHPDDS
jgi:PPK2 family polyphosphate:nucleotide phosphotransferase